MRMFDQEVLKLLGPDRRSNPGFELEVVKRLCDVIDAPKSSPRTLSAGVPDPERKRTGIMHNSGSAFMIRHTSKPVMSGMSRSSRIRSGCWDLAASVLPCHRLHKKSRPHRRPAAPRDGQRLYVVIDQQQSFHD